MKSPFAQQYRPTVQKLLLFSIGIKGSLLTPLTTSVYHFGMIWDGVVTLTLPHYQSVPLLKEQGVLDD